MGFRRRGFCAVVLGLAVVAASCSTDTPESNPATTSSVTETTAALAVDGAEANDTAPETSVVAEASESPVPPAQLARAVAPPGLYVSPDGDDANDGRSPETSFRTIANAVKQLGPGDTLWVMDGEYVEDERTDSAIVVDRSGTADAWIRISAFPGASPVIRTDHKNGMKIEAASYVEVIGLTFVGTVNSDLLAGGRAYSGAGINVDGLYSGGAQNHHVRIIGNTISGYGAGGIPVTGTSHVEIRDNVVFDVAKIDANQHSGISIFEPANQGFGDDSSGYSNYITGNTVYRVENTVPDPRLGRITDGNCIIMDLTRETGYTGRTLISNNLCVDNGGRGVQVYRSAFVDVVNNTLYGNSRSPQVAEQGGDLGAFESLDVTFANNLVFTSGAHAPARASQSDQISFLNNVYVGEREALYGGHSFSGDQWIDGASGVVVSPGTNPDPSQFALVADSVAIDAGTDVFETVVDRDFAGRERTVGAMPDIGAFEFVE